MKNKIILFVCTGNTCRSPMAELILKSKLKNAGLSGIRVRSAGTFAETGSKMSKNSAEALKLLGIKPYAFKSKKLDEKTLKNSSMTICMDEGNKERLKGEKNVYTIGEITGLGNIPDPYGGDLNEYIIASRKIEDACNVILKKIIEVKGGN